MKKTDQLGNFEQMVLTAVMRLGEEAYGVSINEKVGEIAEMSHGKYEREKNGEKINLDCRVGADLFVAGLEQSS